MTAIGDPELEVELEEDDVGGSEPASSPGSGGAGVPAAISAAAARPAAFAISSSEALSGRRGMREVPAPPGYSALRRFALPM